MSTAIRIGQTAALTSKPFSLNGDIVDLTPNKRVGSKLVQ